MANEKTKQHWAAFWHALVYSLGFVVFAPSLKAGLVIFGTHFLIDRYRLARYVVWAKNAALAPSMWWWKMFGATAWQSGPICPPGAEVTFAGATLPFSECSGTGYPPDRPAWLAVWLLIFADNIMHICINGAALKFL